MPEAEPWTMPAWMEPYRELIADTGGNSIEELYNDSTTTARSNLIRAALIIAVKDQVGLLYRLHRLGCLRPPVPRDPPRCDRAARKGTGTGICDRLLAADGSCDRASSHLDT